MIKYFAKAIRHRFQKKVRLNILRPANSFPSLLHGDSYWFASPNLWEPSVLLALRDLCQPGMVVFDVGANFGGVTSAMSRLVGPMGTVCAFEASPRIIGYLQGNVVAQGHRNVTVFHRAVFSESNKLLMVYEGDHLNDSIYEDQSPTKAGNMIRTLALDDFCKESNLVPNLVKMDIEGAEFDAVQGFLNIIQRSQPHLILEQKNSDIQCYETLANLGYRFLDLSTYREIKNSQDFSRGKILMNILAIHKTKMADLPYPWPPTFESLLEIGETEIVEKGKSGLRLGKKSFPAGRYLIDCRFEAYGKDNNMVCQVDCGGKTIFRYNAYSKLLADTYTDWVIEVPFAGDLEIQFKFLDGTSDDSFVFRHIKVNRVKDYSMRTWPSFVLE
jgi:FkbM family methyltransferase